MQADRIDPAFGNWLAGFADGEGCFYIGRIVTRKKGVEYVNYRAAFTLSLRDDDRAVLEHIQTILGRGRIVTRPARSVGKWPMAALEIGDKAGVAALVELFDRFPLRAKKARDYALWRQAVIDWQTKGRGGGPHDWSLMAALHEQMKAGRKYTSVD